MRCGHAHLSRGPPSRKKFKAFTRVAGLANACIASFEAAAGLVLIASVRIIQKHKLSFRSHIE